MNNDPLLKPFEIKHLTLKNRVMLTSHEPAYAEDGMPKERYRAYHVERAKGGVALTMTAGSAAVSRDSPPAFNNILAYKDEVVPWMRDLADECHEYGTAVMIQLTHLGRRTRWDQGDWLPTVSSTGRPEAAHRAFPKLAEAWDIERIIKDYVDAADRMHAAGLDGLEIQASGHLLDQFWSPLTNELEAPYGGSIENRMRLTFDILRGIRERVGERFLLGVRYTVDERLEGGLTADDGLNLSRKLKESGLTDFLNVVRGHIDTDPGLTDQIPIQGMASAPHLDHAGLVRKETEFPTFHGSKIQDVATARHAIASGKVDMVGMTRAHMADPHLVSKVMAGREHEVRPCVGANYCLDRIYQGGAALCIHNPATGRETTESHFTSKAAEKRRIVVIGAGPGGMEAARVAAERGHEVVVMEAMDQPGGQVALTAQTERRREMMSIIDWRYERCQAMGVDFRFNVYAEASEVMAEAPDVVIVATGGFPNEEALPSGNEHAVSCWDILSGHETPAQKVLIYDEAGDHVALQAAEMVAKTGASVELVTPERNIAPEVMSMNLVPYMRTLQTLDVTCTPTYRLASIAPSGSGLAVSLASDYVEVHKSREVEQVIVNMGIVPTIDLYDELKPMARNLGKVDYDNLIAGTPQSSNDNPEGTFQLFRIGDAVAPRNTHAAIYDALRLVKAL